MLGEIVAGEVGSKMNTKTVEFSEIGAMMTDKRAWKNNPEDFQRFARVCFELSENGAAPYWHLRMLIKKVVEFQQSGFIQCKVKTTKIDCSAAEAILKDAVRDAR